MTRSTPADSAEPARRSKGGTPAQAADSGFAGPGGGAPAGAHTGALSRTLHEELIPRLARAHRQALAQIRPEDVVSFTDDLLRGDEPALLARLAHLARLGFAPQTLCMELLAPAARRLGKLWDDDRCDFTAVTIGTGQLQRLLRSLAAGQWPGEKLPGAGLHLLLSQPPHEQHSLGLLMVAQFFEAAGWAVSGGVGEHLRPAAEVVRDTHVDVVGFSVGSEVMLPWLREQIAAVRLASRNPDVLVMVGGPVLHLHPEWLPQLGADLCPQQVHDAPVMAALGVREALLRRLPQTSA